MSNETRALDQEASKTQMYHLGITVLGGPDTTRLMKWKVTESEAQSNISQNGPKCPP